MRKLEAERRNMEATLKQRGFAKDSPTFAPRSCRGVFARSVRSNDLTTKYLETYEGLYLKRFRTKRPERVLYIITHQRQQHPFY